jgi:hypothetical protein
MSLAVQSSDQHLTSFAGSTAIVRNHENLLGEAVGLERPDVSCERLITRSDDGYFNADTTTDHTEVTDKTAWTSMTDRRSGLLVQ